MNKKQEDQSINHHRTLAYLTYLRLTRVMQKLRRLAEAEVQETGFSTALFAVLFELLAAEGITQQDLADTMELTKGNITQLVEKLERDGLLRRERVGRINRLYLTAAGRKFALEHLSNHEGFVEARFAALEIEEQAQLLTLLRKLDRHLK
jgi:MarR family transcriptional regulator, 2-MHQ and catechol-resistance regulon repressor